MHCILLSVLFKIVQEDEIFLCVGLDHECVIVLQPAEELLSYCVECCFLKDPLEGGSSHQ